MNVVDFMTKAASVGASDVFLVPGMPYSYKLNGEITYQGDRRILPTEMDKVIADIYKLARRDLAKVTKFGDDGFSFAIPGVSRFRASVMYQRGSLAAIIRIVKFDLPDFDKMHLASAVYDIADLTKGLVLVTGPAGSGKTTTLAAIINKINRTHNSHVITLEDPIEYLHKHDKGVITQREIGTDTESYMVGLVSALRQAPDVILLGEIKDANVLRIAMAAAETGHLVITTLHTTGAVNTIDRLLDMYGPDDREQARAQLATILQVITSQELLPLEAGGVMPAWEVMHVTNELRGIIRQGTEEKDMETIMRGSSNMQLMDDSIFDLYKQGLISKDNAVIYSTDSESMTKRVEGR